MTTDVEPAPLGLSGRFSTTLCSQGLQKLYRSAGTYGGITVTVLPWVLAVSMESRGN